MNTILIIGANSALAQDVITVLSQDNKIITAGRKGCDIDCDITEPFTVPAKVDIIINFAASFGGDSDAQIIGTEKTNLLGTLNVCVAAKKAGVGHIIIISSLSAVVGEDSPYYSIYAISKRHADQLAQYYCRLNSIPLTILRPSQIYGDSNGFAKHQPFFYHIVDKAQKGQDVSIYGKNDALRNYIHSADLSQIISRVAAKRIEGVYPCAYTSDVRFSQVVEAAQKVFNKGGKMIFLKDRPDIPDNIFTKDLSIYEKADYYPQISLEAGLKRLKQYRAGK